MALKRVIEKHSQRHPNLEAFSCRVGPSAAPRNPETLPGFTTNEEFDRYANSGLTVYSRPHNRYLDRLYEKLTGQVPLKTLADTVRVAIQLATGPRVK